jgi:hypothetical protein
MDHNIRVIDHGQTYAADIFFGRIYRDGRWLWQTNSVAWYDDHDDRSIKNLKTTMDRGCFALLGAHCYEFGSLSKTGDREDAIMFLNWLETDYPYLHWFIGEELAEFWDELAEIKEIQQVGYNNNIGLTWEGKTTKDETIIIFLRDERSFPVNCFIDDIAVDWEKRSNRLFVRSPELGDGLHKMEITLNKEIKNQAYFQDWHVGISNGNLLEIEHLFEEDQTLDVTVYDTMGRRVHTFENQNIVRGSRKLMLNMPEMPSGPMIIKISIGQDEVVRKMVFVK